MWKPFETWVRVFLHPGRRTRLQRLGGTRVRKFAEVFRVAAERWAAMEREEEEREEEEQEEEEGRVEEGGEGEKKGVEHPST